MSFDIKIIFFGSNDSGKTEVKRALQAEAKKNFSSEVNLSIREKRQIPQESVVDSDCEEEAEEDISPIYFFIVDNSTLNKVPEAFSPRNLMYLNNHAHVFLVFTKLDLPGANKQQREEVRSLLSETFKKHPISIHLFSTKNAEERYQEKLFLDFYDQCLKNHPSIIQLDTLKNLRNYRDNRSNDPREFHRQPSFIFKFFGACSKWDKLGAATKMIERLENSKNNIPSERVTFNAETQKALRQGKLGEIVSRLSPRFLN